MHFSQDILKAIFLFFCYILKSFYGFSIKIIIFIPSKDSFIIYESKNNKD